MDVKRAILLNPGPATTTDSVKYAQVITDICPREKEFGDMVAWIHHALVSFVADPNKYTCVLIGGSGTAAVEMVLSSVVPQNEGLFVVSNGSYGERIAKIARIYKIPTVKFESSTSTCVDYAQLEHAIQTAQKTMQSEGKTLSHFAVVHHETTSGLVNDIARLGAICKEHNLILLVDAMSSYAAMPIDMEAMGILYLIASSNKNLQGMAGIGIAICNTAALTQTKDIPMRNLYLNLYDQYRYFCETQQFRFTPPVQTLYALQQAIQEAQQEGIPARYNRYRQSYYVLRQGMERLGFTALVADDISSGLITTFFEPRDEKYSFDTMHDYLYERGFTIYPGKVSQGGTFRIANIGDITSKDIEHFLYVLESYLVNKGIARI